MSKAFTRESDDLPDPPRAALPPSPLPPGTRNYITPAGADRLRQELDRLIELQEAASSPGAEGDDGSAVPAKSDARILSLRRSLQTIEVVPPPPPPHDLVRFGATVTVRDPAGIEERYRIVGVDETDPERDWISWLSPLARALINAHLGQTLRIKLPGGERNLEIVGITYE